MRRYPYKDDAFTITELEHHPDCLVSRHELERNLWRYKLPAELAMVTPIKSRRHRCKDTYPYMGRMFTTFELLELSECIVSYQVLRRLLREGVPVEYAIRNEKPEKTYEKSKTKPKPLKIPPNVVAQGSRISILGDNPPVLDKTKTYEYLVLQNSGNYIMDKNGINIEKTIDRRIK